MGEFYLGEIRLFSYASPPRGWARCEGQLLPINSNQALYSLIGNAHGGSAPTTFALPDLRGRAVLGTASSGPLPVGAQVGTPTVTLTVANLPPHAHDLPVASARTSSRAAGNADAPGGAYGAPAGPVATDQLASAGAGQPHENRPPFIAMAYAIALVGNFPPRP